MNQSQKIVMLAFCLSFVHFQQSASVFDQFRLFFLKFKKTVGLFRYQYNLLSENNNIYNPELGFIPHYPNRPPINQLTDLNPTQTLVAPNFIANNIKFTWLEGSQISNLAHKVIERQNYVPQEKTVTTSQIPCVATAEENNVVIARFCLLVDLEYKTATITSSSFISDNEKNNPKAHDILHNFLEIMLKEKHIKSIFNNTISEHNKKFWDPEIKGYGNYEPENLTFLYYEIYDPKSGTLPKFQKNLLKPIYDPSEFVKTEEERTKNNEKIVWKEAEPVKTKYSIEKKQEHHGETELPLGRDDTSQMPVVATLFDQNNTAIAQFIFTIDYTYKTAVIRSTSFVGGIERSNPKKHSELYTFIEKKLKTSDVKYVIANPVVNQDSKPFWRDQGFDNSNIKILQ